MSLPRDNAPTKTIGKVPMADTIKRDYEAEMQRRFEGDTADHTLIVVHDDGLYRHLRCQKPNTWSYGFDVMTWPGYLAYAGDMGDFLFTRVRDMFEFFRDQSANPHYWSEKLRGPGPAHQAVLDFDHDAFEAAARERNMDVWDPPFNTQDAARLLVEDGMDPYDLPKLDRWSAQFLWACHAIPWAIARYDEAKP